MPTSCSDASAPTGSSAAKCGSTSRPPRRALLERVAKPLGMDATAAADGILRIAATAMSYAVKGVTTERGLDAGDFALVAYGGAGPLHAVEVAREIGIRTVIIPTAPGVFSAFGMLFSDLRYDFVRTWFTQLEDAPFDRIERIYRDLENAGPCRDRQQLGRAAEDHAEAGGRHALCGPGACGHRGPAAQGVRTGGPRCDQARFRRHARAALRHLGAGRARRDREPAQHRHRRHAQATAGKDPAGQKRADKTAFTGKRSVYLQGKFQSTPTYARAALAAGNRINGPALIEEHASTTVLLPGDRLAVDAYGNLVIKVAGGR